MAEITQPYTQGTPCWVDLMASDQQAAIDYYSDLFGWNGEVGPPEFGGYSVCELRGKSVAGIGPAMSMDGGPPPPTVWTTYLAVDDIEQTAAKMKANGGQLFMEPMQVGDKGHMLVCADPSGAVVGAWQHLEFIGAERVNEPGAVTWNELNTRDLAAALPFYEAVFGLTFEPMPQMPAYHAMMANGRVCGGAQQIDDTWPAETPPHWMTYFAVDDPDSTVAAAVRAGSTLIVPTFDMMAGRMAVVQDPQGGVFAVIKPTDVAPPA
ncbi:VOC family protein [Yinghuangia seranimata]|uniref:VOC family protein n=1 Tax=Yinghuangia seranimata TaxID=408067 RepID=UPI00248C8859|nr:VOC family protein [Yinghuangia seranimata]MDI2125570.1 VOC family protein [Yinghuangia seranimata]